MKGEFIFSHFVWCNITCKVPEKAKQISNKDQSKCKAKVKQILSKGQAKAKQNLSKGWAKAKQRPSKGHFRLLRISYFVISSWKHKKMRQFSARPNSEGSRTVLRSILIFFGEQKFWYKNEGSQNLKEPLIFKGKYLIFHENIFRFTVGLKDT